LKSRINNSLGVSESVRPRKVSVKTADTSVNGMSVELPPALWSQWPAAWVSADGQVHASQVQLIETLSSVLIQESGQTLRLEPRANRRLWALIDREAGTALQWKILDPAYWPFIGMVGWSSQTPEMLQIVAWNLDTLPWQVDDSWRRLLAATAAVKAKRRKRVA
jgi:hypothetical protein